VALSRVTLVAVLIAAATELRVLLLLVSNRLMKVLAAVLGELALS
jgi:hypothetical protein